MDSNPFYNEKEIIERLVAGEDTAFRILYDRYWNRVYATALGISQSAALAMDVVQDTFTLIWKNRDKLHDVENLEAYIYVTGRNRLLSLLRSRRIHQDIDLLNTRLPDEEKLSPERQAAIRQFQEQVHKAAALLPPQQAEVFRLSRFEEKSYEEIAAAMGISRDTVRNHLVKALNFMRSYFYDRQDLTQFCWLILFFSPFFSI